MPKKPKFKPEITRIKLNPEQAVLACNCFSQGWQNAAGFNRSNGFTNNNQCGGRGQWFNYHCMWSFRSERGAAAPSNANS